MRLVVREFSQSEWTEIVSEFQDLSLMQLWEYGEAKAALESWRVERAVFVEGDRVAGAAQALLRTVPWVGRGLVRINRGPLWRRLPDEPAGRVAAMLAEIRRHWVEERRMYVRVAPPVRDADVGAASVDGAGYARVAWPPAWSSARLDLTADIATLRARLDQKWRNGLNKAERLGVTVQDGVEQFPVVVAEHAAMLRARGYETTVSPELLERLQRLLPPGRRLWALRASLGDASLGGVLVARYGDVAEYLVGAVGEEGRRMNVGNLLLWAALCRMKALGCRWFDLGGMDAERTPAGILHFKAGLGGSEYRLAGEFESEGGDWLSQAVRWRVNRAVQKVRG
jgi:hypothetical protein